MARHPARGLGAILHPAKPHQSSRVHRWGGQRALRPGPQGKGCPAAKQRDQETVSSAASSLTGWGAPRLSLHLCVCNEGTTTPVRTANHPEDGTALSAPRALGGLGDGGGARGTLGRGSQSRSAGAATVASSGRGPEPHAPPAGAREAPRAPPHVGPHGLADPASDWSSCSQSEGAVSSGRDDWSPRAGRGGGGAPFCSFLLGAAGPASRAPSPGSPYPEPGLGPQGSPQAPGRQPEFQAQLLQSEALPAFWPEQEMNLPRRQGPSGRAAAAVRGRPPAAAARKAADVQDARWTAPPPLPAPVFLMGRERSPRPPWAEASRWADCGAVRSSATGTAGSPAASRPAQKGGRRASEERPRGPCNRASAAGLAPPPGSPGAARPLAESTTARTNHAGRRPNAQWEWGGRGRGRVRNGLYVRPRPCLWGPALVRPSVPGDLGVPAPGGTLHCAGGVAALLPPDGARTGAPAGHYCRTTSASYKRETQNLRAGPSESGGRHLAARSAAREGPFIRRQRRRWAREAAAGGPCRPSPGRARETTACSPVPTRPSARVPDPVGGRPAPASGLPGFPRRGRCKGRRDSQLQHVHPPPPPPYVTRPQTMESEVSSELALSLAAGSFVHNGGHPSSRVPCQQQRLAPGLPGGADLAKALQGPISWEGPAVWSCGHSLVVLPLPKTSLALEGASSCPSCGVILPTPALFPNGLRGAREPSEETASVQVIGQTVRASANQGTALPDSGRDPAGSAGGAAEGRGCGGCGGTGRRDARARDAGGYVATKDGARPGPSPDSTGDAVSFGDCVPPPRGAVPRRPPRSPVHRAAACEKPLVHTAGKKERVCRQRWLGEGEPVVCCVPSPLAILRGLGCATWNSPERARGAPPSPPRLLARAGDRSSVPASHREVSEGHSHGGRPRQALIPAQELNPPGGRLPCPSAPRLRLAREGGKVPGCAEPAGGRGSRAARRPGPWALCPRPASALRAEVLRARHGRVSVVRGLPSVPLRPPGSRSTPSCPRSRQGPAP
ncbi:collagen alpha-1(I) chain-like [Hyaena hyaena]|uniref:collagen alpha-1(I) chain-like n=1 Tax=Hyaena hyaena TaxID=95912 RepID=UPI001922A894|nr:collagen alpha-1(I) chain-like [Hyaena hyaena]